jgi:aromatic-L-amino-acid decarboxylase
LLPLGIIAQAGTTNTGAVDDLEALADLAARNQVWLHVDAAYGGFFLLTKRGREVFRGMERADSVTLDPHKGLFLPYGTGCLLVRDRHSLRRVFGVRGEYMTMAVAKGDEFVDFCDVSPELSRDFRGLRVWLPLQMHGAAAFRQCLDEKLDLARYVEEQLRMVEGIQLVAPAPLSIVAFRLHHPTWSESETNDRNREFLAQINASNRVWLTSTTIDTHFVLRICILSFRTHRDRIDECLAIIRNAAEYHSLSQRQSEAGPTDGKAEPTDKRPKT